MDDKYTSTYAGLCINKYVRDLIAVCTHEPKIERIKNKKTALKRFTKKI